MSYAFAFTFFLRGLSLCYEDFFPLQKNELLIRWLAG